jgi:uncharacterized membrane protein
MNILVTIGRGLGILECVVIGAGIFITYLWLLFGDADSDPAPPRWARFSAWIVTLLVFCYLLGVLSQ